MRADARFPYLQSVITSPFIQKDIWGTMEVASHNSVNITKNETLQCAEKCLAFGMFIRSINIDKLKDSVTTFEFDNQNTTVRVYVMTNNFY